MLKHWMSNMTQYCRHLCTNLQPVNHYLPYFYVPLPGSIRPEDKCCPASGSECSSPGCDVSEQPEFISSAYKVIEPQHPKLVCCRYDDIMQTQAPSKRFERSYADHLPLYLQSETYRRQGGS